MVGLPVGVTIRVGLSLTSVGERVGLVVDVGELVGLCVWATVGLPVCKVVGLGEGCPCVGL